MSADDAHSGPADRGAGGRGRGLYWKIEGDRSIAMLGSVVCGSAGRRHWSGVGPAGVPVPDTISFDWSAVGGFPQAAQTLEDAKAALELHVEDWIRLAGLAPATEAEHWKANHDHQVAVKRSGRERLAEHHADALAKARNDALEEAIAIAQSVEAPPDVVEFGRRHKIPEFVKATYGSAVADIVAAIRERKST